MIIVRWCGGLWCAVLGATAQAETLVCDMQGRPLQFTIDRHQFVAPHHPNEPPRRKVTTVTLGDQQFQAEPILLGARRGFWAEGPDGGEIIFMAGPDGRATYADPTLGDVVEGTCDIH